MQSCSTADEYMQKLPSFDQDWARESKDAEAAGEVSRSVSMSQSNRYCLLIFSYHLMITNHVVFQ